MVEPRFVVDVNVGRLAKWLRVMGYDSLFVPDVDDAELLRIALQQDRTIVTRDRYILERRLVTAGRVEAVLVTSDDFRRQMQQLTRQLGLRTNGVFSMCIECNAQLSEVNKAEVEDRVPPFVLRTQEKFHWCPRCDKLYWRGTHWRNMCAELAGFMEGA